MLDKQNEKGDRLTRAIRNGGLCAILKFCSPPEHSCRLKVLHPQTATSYSPYPLAVSLKKDNNDRFCNIL